MNIYSHNPRSQGARALARALGIQRIRHEGSRFAGAAHKVVINWGAHTLPEQVTRCALINLPQKIMVAGNKLCFFQDLKDTKLTPTYTTDRELAQSWTNPELANKTVVSRLLLNASGGKGIVLTAPGGEVPQAPLHVLYVPKKDEYRVHIMGHDIIDVQQKRRRHGHEAPDWKVRNHENGFIYARGDLDPPDCIGLVATEAFAHFEIDFGAVDIIYNEERGRAYALEINTAPGLEGATVKSYADAIKRRWM